MECNFKSGAFYSIKNYGPFEKGLDGNNPEKLLKLRNRGKPFPEISCSEIFENLDIPPSRSYPFFQKFRKMLLHWTTEVSGQTQTRVFGRIERAYPRRIVSNVKTTSSANQADINTDTAMFTVCMPLGP